MGFFRFLVIGMFYEIVIWLRIFELRRPKINPANADPDYGDSDTHPSGIHPSSQGPGLHLRV